MCNTVYMYLHMQVYMQYKWLPYLLINRGCYFLHSLGEQLKKKVIIITFRNRNTHKNHAHIHVHAQHVSHMHTHTYTHTHTHTHLGEKGAVQLRGHLREVLSHLRPVKNGTDDGGWRVTNGTRMNTLNIPHN